MQRMMMGEGSLKVGGNLFDLKLGLSWRIIVIGAANFDRGCKVYWMVIVIIEAECWKYLVQLVSTALVEDK